MSQVVKIQGFKINSLSVLRSAAQRCGLTLDGDRIKLSSGRHINIVREGDYYALEADLYYSDVKNAVNNLRQYYAVEFAKRIYTRKGYRVVEQKQSDGNIKLYVYRR